MAILIEPPANWDNLQGKPAILADNQISWSEIKDLPPRIAFLANNTPGKWQEWLLASNYSDSCEWLGIVSGGANQIYSVAQRDGSAWLRADGFKSYNMPTNPIPLTSGSFWKDVANGNVVKIV
jgi:hypothetical protein